MATASSESQDRTASYPAPKRITVTSCGDGIEVRVETERPDASPEEENNNKKAISPLSEPIPSSTTSITDAQVAALTPKDGFFETELEPKTTTFVISDEEWSFVTPRNMPSGGRLLTGPWPHILSKHLKESNPFCSFAFHYNRLKTENSRKRMAPFFKAIGMCRIKECGVTVRLQIRGINESKRLVDVSYNGTLRHRVTAPWKPGHFKNEKQRGMLLLGLCRDSEPDLYQHLPSESQVILTGTPQENEGTPALEISQGNKGLHTTSEMKNENKGLSTMASEISKQNEQLPIMASEISNENEGMSTTASQISKDDDGVPIMASQVYILGVNGKQSKNCKN